MYNMDDINDYIFLFFLSMQAKDHGKAEVGELHSKLEKVIVISIYLSFILLMSLYIYTTLRF